MRKLVLRKESLVELTTDEMSKIAGGAETRICITDPCITPPVSGLRCALSLDDGVCQ